MHRLDVDNVVAASLAMGRRCVVTADGDARCAGANGVFTSLKRR